MSSKHPPKKTTGTETGPQITSSPLTIPDTPDDTQDPLTQKPETQRLPPLPDMPHPNWLLSLSLDLAVPNEIVKLYQRFRGTSGILPWMVGEAVAFGHVLAARGD